MSGASSGARLHNEMVESWVELFAKRPPGTTMQQSYYAFKALHPDANVFEIINTLEDAQSRMASVIIELDAIEAAFNAVISVLGPINNNPRFETDLMALANSGHREAAAALAEYQQIVPLMGHCRNRFLPKSLH